MTDRKCNILIVEDDESIRELLGYILTGLQLFYAPTGEDGLRILEQEMLDIVILDLQLPGIHGIDVLKKIKGNEQTKVIEVIVLTSVTDSSVAVECLKEGAYWYLMKDSISQIEIFVTKALQERVKRTNN